MERIGESTKEGITISFFTQFSQNVIVSTGNSSTDNLAGDATFTGTLQSTLGVAGIQINLNASQNCTIYIDQSMDDVPNWDIIDAFDYYTSKGGMSFTVQATASYVRVRVKNLNASVATTYFRLQMALCPIVEAVPRSLTASGNFKSSINEMLEGTFPGATSTPTSELRITPHTRLAGSTFNGSTLDGNFWLSTPTSGGTAILSAGRLELNTNTTANGAILVTSIQTARYVAGCTNYFRGVGRCPAITGANVRRWGAFDTSDGYFFEYNGTTLSLVSRKTSGATTDTPVTAFNGDLGSTYVLDTNAHTWEIYWSNKSVWYFVDGGFLHKESFNTNTAVSTPSLKVGLECKNTSSNTNANILYFRVASISRLGQLVTESVYKNISSATTTVCKLGSGRLNRVIVNDPNTAGVITIYDNTAASGTKIATLTIPTPGAQFKPIPTSIEYNLPFNNGLTVVTSTATNVTVVYE